MKKKIIFGAMVVITALLLAPVFGYVAPVVAASVFSLLAPSGLGLSFVSTCGQLTAGIAINCTKPLQAGLVSNLIIINWDDISAITRNGTNPQIIEGITLASGKVAYMIEGKNNSLTAKKSLLVGKYDNSYDHEITGVAFDISPLAKAQLEKMGNGKFVCIVENNYKDSDGSSAFEIYGLDAGMYPSSIESDTANQDTQSGYLFTLKTKTDREPHLPATAFLTDYATTKTWINGLL